jgi:hypothetical protein
LATFALSKAASTSSRMKNGAGRKEWMANRRARAATVFSPPESWSMSRNRFIGGMAWYLTPSRYGS